MDIKLTQKLFSILIKKPTLSEKLLERPPFKFLHDVITETIRLSGYLSGFFSENELNADKVSSLKESKIAFLQKFIDILNIDGSLDHIKPAKIVAGKEPENTNILLQKFASEAALHLANNNSNNNKLTKTSKRSSSKSLKDLSSKSSKDKIKSNLDASLSKSSKKSSDSKKLSRGFNTKTEETVLKSQTKSRDLTKNGDKIKEKKTKSLKAKENVHNESVVDEGVSSPHILSNIHGELESGRTLPERESSGGTSKGGDDSGIADETGAESEHHDSESLKIRSLLAFKNAKDVYDRANAIDSAPSTSSVKQELILVRPTTGMSVRPQTSMGRPGTAIARAAPPKLKKTKIADINVLEVGAQPVATNTALIMENNSISQDNEDVFLVEEEEDYMLRGANVTSLNKGKEHGTLVNKIIENTRELEKDNLLPPDYSDSFMDFHEQRRIKYEIENVQKSLQNTTQNIQPLARTLEYITNDFDSILKEIEENRKITLSSTQIMEDRSKNSSESIFTLSATLRNLEVDIRETRQQIAAAILSVINNDKLIEIQLCGE